MEATIPLSAPIKITSHNQYHSKETLSLDNVLPSPIEQFRVWFNSCKGSVAEPEAMSLSTASKAGLPSSRTVLLKEVDDEGFVFYTNYNSRKSQELKENPYAALNFYWKEVHRQVRIVGRVETVSAERNAKYFSTRPIGSKLGAWASPQSAAVREDEVQLRYEELEKQYGTEDGVEQVEIPTPPFWGGWRVLPHEVEFWLGKPSRLHDRILYTRDETSGSWKTARLGP